MLGPPKPRWLDQPLAASLEALVPADNVSRRLEAKLDPQFVRDWTQKRFAERSRPSIDLVVCFTRQHVLVFDGICSERQRIATANTNGKG